MATDPFKLVGRGGASFLFPKTWATACDREVRLPPRCATSLSLSVSPDSLVASPLPGSEGFRGFPEHQKLIGCATVFRWQLWGAIDAGKSGSRGSPNWSAAPLCSRENCVALPTQWRHYCIPSWKGKKIKKYADTSRVRRDQKSSQNTGVRTQMSAKAEASPGSRWEQGSTVV